MKVKVDPSISDGMYLSLKNLSEEKTYGMLNMMRNMKTSIPHTILINTLEELKNE